MGLEALRRNRVDTQVFELSSDGFLVVRSAEIGSLEALDEQICSIFNAGRCFNSHGLRRLQRYYFYRPLKPIENGLWLHKRILSDVFDPIRQAVTGSTCKQFILSPCSPHVNTRE